MNAFVPTRRRCCGIATLLLLAWSPGCLLAQDPVSDDETIAVGPSKSAPPAPQAGPPRRQIEEIIVTATKREVSVRDLAMSVSAMDGQMIEDAGLQTVEELIDQIPGVNLVDSEEQLNGTRITIRGIAAGFNQVDTSGIFIDETPFSDPFLPVTNLDANPFDMAAVEVLKGPVGTLFGGSSLNGAIRYIPKKPEFETWEGKAFAELRSTHYSQGLSHVLGAAVNMPLFERDDLALRVVGMDRSNRGVVDSLNPNYQRIDANEKTQSMIRAALRAQPTNTLDLSVLYIQQDTAVADYSYSNDTTARHTRNSNPVPSPTASNYDILQLKAQWDLGFAELVGVISNSDKATDLFWDTSGTASGENTPASTIATFYDSTADLRSHELRLVSTGSGNWDWLIGAFDLSYDTFGEGLVFFGESIDAELPVPNLGPLENVAVTEDGVTELYFIYNGGVSEQALFGEFNWRFLPRFEVTGGLRLYRLIYDVAQTYAGPLCLLADPTCANGLSATKVLDDQETGINPKLSLKWAPHDDLMVYLTSARGFRFGGINVLSSPEIPDLFEGDWLWNHELGVRAQWLDGRLITDLTIFHIDWINALIDVQTSDGVFVYTDNVGSVVGDGAEAYVSWLTPIPGVSINVTAAYADIRTAEAFENDSTGAPEGTRWPRAPEWQTVSTLAWAGRGGVFDLTASVSHSYFGVAIAGFGSQASQTIFGYSSWDFQLLARAPVTSALPDLALNVTNLTDVPGINFYSPPIDDSNGGGQVLYTRPMSVSLRLTFNF